jgi:mutator protein MutT
MRRGIDYIGVGVGAIIVNREGKLFLAQRGPQAKNERGLWEFPGGSVEFGERLTEALKREIREEFGVEIEIRDLLNVADHILPDEGQHWVSPSYVCVIQSGEPQIKEPDKCTAIGWFEPTALPPELTVVTRLDWQLYLERINLSA